MSNNIRPHLRASARFLALLGFHLLGAAILLGIAIWRRLGGSVASAPAIIQWWFQGVSPILGLRIRVEGQQAKSALIVANHISWLDIAVLGSLGPIGFLSKAEVRRWPLIGWMAAQVGTLFIARGGNQTADLIQRIEQRLREQRPVVIFAEGTTSDGRQLRGFYPRLLAAGQQPGIDVQPVAIRYGTNTEPDLIAPFIDDDALIPSVWRVLRRTTTEASVHFLTPIVSAGMDRRKLTTQCEQQIAEALEVPIVARATAKRRGSEVATQ
ncbi:MAG: 1-acyl-sn-glycerol-3-phosphate acyltransferase [Lamprobacter sp.]|uniref:lysophospholipid acyltransferase family protein n=1 Tax=Lamprobacter sp. TaxID=3100796 RepID=UPI002B257A55|nr:1-acyl-sn-glycerol-3-phosphate acyltransferase [Lamprobacter sp.]MEA3640459.1 1-acyl-sn-glycerol-3-phosphate acyltransferase [Lamprobacter sp.]